MSLHWMEVSERIRTFVGDDSPESLQARADRLKVTVTELRQSMEGGPPVAIIRVVAAIAWRYGVDAMWLLSGESDPTAHRRALDHTRDEVEDFVRALVAELLRRPSGGDDRVSPTR